MIDPGRTQTGGDDGAARRSVRVHQLVVAFAPERVEARVRLLDGRPIVIGRDPGDGGVRLPDPEASRLHAELGFDRDRDRWILTDRGSRNGLHVDGVPCRVAELADGAVIRIGGSLLVFVSVEVPSDAPLVGEDAHLLGTSVRMQLLRGELAQVAARTLPVLLLGESGTGKERAARAVHARSGRPGPLVSVNCAAIAPALAESELFGHVASAFTGAGARRDGMFVAADRGTLFLDEIGELAPELQAKLLRALALGEVRPVGSNDAVTVDVRVVAATLVDLGQAVAAGGFRGDLYARLAGWTATLPPLRARRDDVLLLASAWMAVHAPTARLSPGAAEALLLYPWPFNVRELQHALDVAVVRAGGELIRAEHLPEAIGAPLCGRGGRRATDAPAPVPLALTIDRAAVPTAEELARVLAHHRGSVALTAAFFERDRKQVYRWMERHGLDRDAFRDPPDR